MGNPYILPEGNVQIAFSGGRTSAYMLHQILEANGGLPERCIVSFQNTGREMPETLDFVQECGNRWGVHIVWLEYRREAPFFEVVSHNSASRNGEPFDALIDAKQYLPNKVTRYCTAEMKVRPAKRYCLALEWERWTAATGIRADEPRRLRGDPSKERWSVWYPLAEAITRTLDTMGIPYRTIDLTEDAEAMARVTAWGYRQAPVVEAEGEHWSGYRPDLIEALRKEQG